MEKRDIPYDDVVKDLNDITDKFNEVSSSKKREIEKIEQSRKQMDVIKEYWKARPNPPSAWANVSLASAASHIHEYKNYVSHTDIPDFTGPTLGAIIGSGDAVVVEGLTLSSLAPPSDSELQKKLEVKFVEIKAMPERKIQRKDVKKYLKAISPHLASAYDGAWESLETNVEDPVRGAAFLMREVVSQVLDILAPKEAIKTPNFIPDPTAKDGVTRKHRLEYIAAHKAKDNFNKKLLEKHIQSFLDTYEGLNDAHKRTSLDKTKIESFLLQADDLLYILFSSINID